jgi:hypothetical protein
MACASQKMLWKPFLHIPRFSGSSFCDVHFIFDTQGEIPYTPPPKKGVLITQHLYLIHLAMHYDKPATNDGLKQASEPYGRRVCLAHDGSRLEFWV